MWGNELININSSVVNSSFNSAVNAGLFLTTNTLIPNNDSQRIIPFTSAAQVGAYFGLDSVEYARAVNYFKAYDGTLNIPPFIWYARYIDTDTAAYIRGGSNPSLSTLQGITSGSITFEFNSSSLQSTGAPIATGSTPTDLVEWSDGTNDFLTIVNDTSETISTFKLIAGTWVLQGSPVATGNNPIGIAYSNIGGLHYVTVANSVDATISTFVWSGTAFSSVGAAVATGVAPSYVTSFTIGVNSYVAVTNRTDDTFTTYEWNGTNFAAILTTPTVATGSSPTLIINYVINSTQYIALINSLDNTFDVYFWNGSNFVSIGAAIDTQTTPHNLKAYAINGSTYISVVSGDNTLETFLWTGTTFSSTGTPLVTGTNPNGIVHFVNNSTDYLIISNTGSNTLFTYQWNGATWIKTGQTTSTGSPEGMTVYFVNNVPWISIINFNNTFVSYNFIATGTTLSGINLSGASSFSDVANILQSAYIAAGIALGTVVYDSTTAAFTVSNGDITGIGTVNYSPVTDLATALKLTEAAGAVLSQGSVALNEATNLNSYIQITTNWAGFTSLFVPTKNQYLAFTAWALTQSNGNAYVYCYWSLDGNLIIPNNTSNPAYDFVDAGYANVINGQVTFTAPVFPIYGDSDLMAMYLGIGASINYTASQGVLSFAYKTQTGIVPLVTTNNAYQAVLANGFNCYGKFSSKANIYNFTQNGAVGGDFKWLDFFYNNIWLADQLQNSLATFFGAELQVPNNQNGYNQISSIITGVANQGIFNGVITAGNQFDPTQTAVLKQQAAGEDITPQLTQKGWALQIIAPSSSDRAKRIPPKTTMWYSNAGSIIDFPMNLVFVF